MYFLDYDRGSLQPAFGLDLNALGKRAIACDREGGTAADGEAFRPSVELTKSSQTCSEIT